MSVLSVPSSRVTYRTESLVSPIPGEAAPPTSPLSQATEAHSELTHTDGEGSLNTLSNAHYGAVGGALVDEMGSSGVYVVEGVQRKFVVSTDMIVKDSGMLVNGEKGGGGDGDGGDNVVS